MAMQTVGHVLHNKRPGVIGATLTTTVREAARKMLEANVACLVVEQYPDILGIVTERDVARRVVAAGKDPAAITLAEVMSSPVATCAPSDSLDHCARLMETRHVRHLIVMDKGELVGVLSLRDILVANPAQEPS